MVGLGHGDESKGITNRWSFFVTEELCNREPGDAAASRSNLSPAVNAESAQGPSRPGAPN